MVLANSPSVITVFNYDGRVLHQNPRSRQYLGDRSPGPDDEDVLALVFGLEPSKALRMFEELSLPGSAGLWKAVMRVPHNLNPSLALPQGAALAAGPNDIIGTETHERPQNQRTREAAASSLHSRQQEDALLGFVPGSQRDLDQPVAAVAEERLTPNTASTCDLGWTMGHESITASRGLRSGNPSLLGHPEPTSSVIARTLASAKLLPSPSASTSRSWHAPSVVRPDGRSASNRSQSAASPTEPAPKATNNSGSQGTVPQAPVRGQAPTPASSSIAHRRPGSVGPGRLSFAAGPNSDGPTPPFVAVKAAGRPKRQRASTAVGLVGGTISQAAAGAALRTQSSRSFVLPAQSAGSVTFVEPMRPCSVAAAGGGSLVLSGSIDFGNGAVLDPLATSTFATLVGEVTPAAPPSAQRAYPAPVVRGNSSRRILAAPGASCAANTFDSGSAHGRTPRAPHRTASCVALLESHEAVVTDADADADALAIMSGGNAGVDDSGSAANMAAAAGLGSGRRPISASTGIAIPQHRSRALTFALSLGTSPLALQVPGSPRPSSGVPSPSTSAAHAAVALPRERAAATTTGFARVCASAGGRPSRPSTAAQLQGSVGLRARQGASFLKSGDPQEDGPRATWNLLEPSAAQQAGPVARPGTDSARASCGAGPPGSAPQGPQAAPDAALRPQALGRGPPSGRRVRTLVPSGSNAATGGPAAADAVAAAESGDNGGDDEGVSAGTDVAGPFTSQRDSGPECWHEVWATAAHDPVTGQGAIIVSQMDVTAKVIAERHLALVMESEHRLVEQLFPRHILQHVTEQWTAGEGAGGGAGGAGGTRGGSARWQPVLRDCTSLATWHQEVTLLFADVKGFTPLCKEISPREVMVMLNSLYSRYDSMLDKYGVYKVETIGDCYFVAGGLIREDEDGMAAVREGGSREDDDPLHAERVFMFAKAMLAAAREVPMPTTGQPVEIRIGIHTGPVVSGVVGTRMPRFCLFGDTVNTASRMESTGQPGAIHVSETTFKRLAPSDQWEPTGGIQVKGKGLMQTYLWRAAERPAQAEDLLATARAAVATASTAAADTLASGSSLMPLSMQLLPLDPGDAAPPPRLSSLSPADDLGGPAEGPSTDGMVSPFRGAFGAHRPTVESTSTDGGGGGGTASFGGFLTPVTHWKDPSGGRSVALTVAHGGGRRESDGTATAVLCPLVDEDGVELQVRTTPAPGFV